MTTSTRIYLVVHNDGQEALVRAQSQAQAVRHIAQLTISAAVATQNQIFEAATKGAKIQEASVPPPSQVDIEEQIEHATSPIPKR